MNTKVIEKNKISVAVIESNEPVITDVDSALDFIATIQYETGCHCIALNKAAIVEDFFKLSTRLAGDILQKFITYRVKFAIIGDFSHYTSKPLKDFIYECNHGRDIFFVSNEQQAVEKLAGVK